MNEPTDFVRLCLTINAVSAERGGNILFSDFSLCLQSGQMLQLSGSNGIGKSTLLRCIAGLHMPLAGNITLAIASESENTHTAGNKSAAGEKALSRVPIKYLSHYLSDKNAMKPQLSARENLRFWQKYFSALQGIAFNASSANTILHSALAQMRITAQAHLPFAALSTGQQRRAGLARLLVTPRPLWLLDEPTAALDRTGQELFADICRRHMRQGGAIIAATHLPLGLEPDKSIVLDCFRPKAHTDSSSYYPFASGKSSAQKTAKT